MPWPACGVDVVEVNRQLLRDVQDVLVDLLRRAPGVKLSDVQRVHRVACELERYVGPPSPFKGDPLATAK